MDKTALAFDELDALAAPLEWWQTAGYVIAVAGGLAAIAAT
ncbi:MULTISPECIES: MpaA3 family daptide-type RiPP [unclassified Rathayibacter]|nr:MULTISPECIES: MpaA3 family daptide-type RiPP [unclassified Rathayibacter]